MNLHIKIFKDKEQHRNETDSERADTLMMQLLALVYLTERKLSKPEDISSSEAIEDLCVCLDCTDWDIFRTTANSLDEFIEAVTSYISFCEDCCVPTRTRVSYNTDNPWFTDKHRQLMFLKGLWQITNYKPKAPHSIHDLCLANDWMSFTVALKDNGIVLTPPTPRTHFLQDPEACRKDCGQPLSPQTHTVSDTLLSRRLQSIRIKTSRLMNSFFPPAAGLINEAWDSHWHWLLCTPSTLNINGKSIHLTCYTNPHFLVYYFASCKCSLYFILWTFAYSLVYTLHIVTTLYFMRTLFHTFTIQHFKFLQYILSC